MSDETFQKNKKFLLRYRYSKKKIERLNDRLLELDMRHAQSPVLSFVPKSKAIGHASDNLLLQKEELIERIDESYKRSDELRKEILDVIDELEDYLQCEVLEMFFIHDRSFEQISEHLCYSLRHVTRIYSDGVRNIQL